MEDEIMLHHVNKLNSIFLLIIIAASCRLELNTKQLRNLREKSYQVSLNAVGYDEYWSVYNAMNDSVRIWAENELDLYKYFNRDSIDYGINYRIDSLLCFNKQKDMCFTGILRQVMIEDATYDSIWHFFGIKINNQWYFFGGAEMVLFRDFYQKEDYPPLSFEKLKELAMKHLYYGYARKSKDGEWYINDAFFNEYYHFDALNHPITTKAERDSSWLKKSRRHWSERNKR